MSNFKVFVSYAHSDSEWAEQFARSLSSRGVKVWLDRFEIRPGESISEAVERGLRESDLLVALISPESVSRPSLFFELGAALGMGKKVIGVVPEGFDASQIPQPLRLRRFLIKESPEATAEELVSQAA